jgi:hypothetical protein
MQERGGEVNPMVLVVLLQQLETRGIGGLIMVHTLTKFLFAYVLANVKKLF